MVLDLRRFDALTLDCYGTLIDWETGLLAALRAALPRSTRGEETGLPIDEGAVAVEGQRVEAAGIERHRRIMPPARGSPT